MLHGRRLCHSYIHEAYGYKFTPLIVHVLSWILKVTKYIYVVSLLSHVIYAKAIGLSTFQSKEDDCIWNPCRSEFDPWAVEGKTGRSALREFRIILIGDNWSTFNRTWSESNVISLHIRCSISPLSASFVFMYSLLFYNEAHKKMCFTVLGRRTITHQKKLINWNMRSSKG